MIRITAKKDGFRRCGVAHTKSATDHPDSRFTAEQLKTLQAEPMLVVQQLPAGASQSGQGGQVGQNDPPKTYPMNSKDTQEKIKVAATLEEVEELAKDDDRKGVTDAAEKRRKELQPAE